MLFILKRTDDEIFTGINIDDLKRS